MSGRLRARGVALLLVGATGVGEARECFVYAGTYTNWEELGPTRKNPPGEASKGIYVFRFDLESGKLTSLGLAVESRNPTYLAFAPSGRVLYATNELYSFHGEASGAVSAFAIEASTGRLTLLNQLATRGTGTCHASVDQGGRILLAANFGSGSVAVFSLAPDGALRALTDFAQDTGTGPNPRQVGPHAHAFNLTPDGRFAVASEFGSDRLLVYRLDATAGKITPADPPAVALKPGSAPRHLAFRPAGDVTYSVNEIDSTLTVLAYDAARGALRELQTVSTLPADFSGRNTAAEVVVHPNGKFLYASNRGHHSIAVFAIMADGRVSLVTHAPCGGRTPRGFHVDADGRWLITANQDTHNLAVFAIDPRTGIPMPTGQTEEVRSPVCVKFLMLAR